MKYIVTTIRILVAGLFIFSGLIKSNDPTGFSYKLEEYFNVFAADMETEQDSFTISLSSADETIESKQVIHPGIPNPQIIVQCSEWKALNISEETDEEELLFLAHASVSSGGTVLFEEDINSSDSNAIAHEMKVVVKTASKPLLEDQIAFKTFAENNRIINFDVSELVKENGFLVGWFQNLASVSLFLAIFICVIEILLGMALLIGWGPKLTVWLLLLMIIFFTFLTWYSWHYDKVTDCGCFGDAIKLTPKQSFYKDLFLSIAILILFIWRNNIRPVFSNSFSVRILSVSMVLFTGFSLYCWHYLPLKNFLKFKEGADILKLSTLDSNAKQEIREFTYIYQNASGDKLELPLNQVNKEDLKAKGYTYLDRIDKIIQEGDAPEIHDFKIMDENANSHLDAFYGAHRWKIMIVMNQLSTADLKAISELKKIIDIWTESGYPVYPLTASSAVEVEQFRHEHQLGVDFYYGDDTNLKSIIRSNPGLLLFDGSVVVKTWPATRLPEPEDLIALTR